MSWRDRLKLAAAVLFKASATTRSTALLVTPGHPVWTPKNYEQLSKESYEANATVYACVNLYTKAIGGLSWMLFKSAAGSRSKTQELEEHAILALLARPNPWEGQSFFFQKLTGYFMLSGNSYLEAVGPTSRQAPPRELFALRPDRMTVLPHAVERIGGYRWEAAGQKADFTPEEILHLKTFHPTDDWYGLSPIEVAARAIDTDNEALTWNFRLLQNSARPSGAFVVQKNLNDVQFKRAQQQLLEGRAGSEFAGLPLLLEGGADWKEMGISPKDMDFIEGGKATKTSIAMAYSAYGELIGLKEATFENRKEARKAFYTQAVLPMADYLRDELNNWLTPRFGERLRLDYDRDAIDALQEDREKVWTRVAAATWLTINEKRVATGYDEVPNGDVLLVPFSVVPLDEAGQTGPSFDQVQQQTEQTAGRPRGAKARTLPADPARERQWKAQVLQFLPIERRYASALARYFQQQRDDVLRRLTASSLGKHAARGTVPETKDAEELLFELDEATDTLRQVSRPFFQEALKKGGTAVWLEVGGDGAFGEDAPAAQLRLADQLTRVRVIVESAKKRVSKVIEGALNDPDGVPSVAEIASRIRETYARLESGQAQTIARTETAKAFNEGREAGMDQLGVEATEWLSARDNEVREVPYDHSIDGETRPRGEAFSNDLRYPHDPSGAAGNVINCRCVALPVVNRGGRT